MKDGTELDRTDMGKCIDFLKNFGFGNVIEDEAYFRYSGVVDLDTYIDNYADAYTKNLQTLRVKFDDGFVVEMFCFFNTVFMRSDFCKMLEMIEKQFDTAIWVTMIQYEWNETGESSIFELMDNLKIGYFEENLEKVCEKVRLIWESK